MNGKCSLGWVERNCWVDSTNCTRLDMLWYSIVSLSVDVCVGMRAGMRYLPYKDFNKCVQWQLHVPRRNQGSSLRELFYDGRVTHECLSHRVLAVVCCACCVVCWNAFMGICNMNRREKGEYIINPSQRDAYHRDGLSVCKLGTGHRNCRSRQI